MIDLVTQLRLRELLGGGQSPTYPQQGIQTPPINGNMSGDEFRPNTAILEQLVSQLSQFPQRSQYQPSTADKFGAAIQVAGSGGPAGMWGGQPVGYRSNPNAAKLQQDILNEPYDRAVDEFGMRLKPLEVAAGLENQANQERRQFEYQREGRDIQRGQLDRQINRDEELARSAQARESMQSLRFNLDRWKAENPEGRIIAVRGGNIVLFNPRTGKMTDTEVPSGMMTDVDRMNMQVENAERLEDIRQGNRLEMSGVTQGNMLDRIEAQGAQSRQTRQTPTAAQSATTMSPSAQNTARINRAIELINQHPEYREFFQFDSNGGRPTGVMLDGSGTTYEMAKSQFLRDSGDISLPSSRGNSSQTARPQAPSQNGLPRTPRPQVEAGRVLITDGMTWGSVPADQANRVPTPWRVVN